MFCILLHLLQQLAHLPAVVSYFALPEKRFQLQKGRTQYSSSDRTTPHPIGGPGSEKSCGNYKETQGPGINLLIGSHRHEALLLYSCASLSALTVA